MIYIGSLLVLTGLQVINVFNNWGSGMFAIGMGALLIYGRFRLEK